MTLAIKLAQNARKTLCFICREEQGFYIFTNDYGVLLTPGEYQDFAIKWAGYRGNALPPLDMKIGDKYQWYKSSEKWIETRVNIESLISVPTEYAVVTPTDFLKDDAGQSQRLLRVDDTRVELLAEDYYQLLKLAGSGELVTSVPYQYKLIRGDYAVMVVMGIRDDSLEDKLEEQLR